MTISIEFIKDKYRLIEKETGQIAKNSRGTPVDGGGHKQVDTAIRQASYINTSSNNKK